MKGTSWILLRLLLWLGVKVSVSFDLTDPYVVGPDALLNSATLAFNQKLQPHWVDGDGIYAVLRFGGNMCLCCVPRTSVKYWFTTGLTRGA